MRIGPYTLDGDVVLAPMAGVTDLPFRILCRRLGAALAPAEMLTSDQRLWNSSKSRRRMDHRGEPEPRVVQLAGADPDALAAAARVNVDLGAQIIDINMGCPAKKVCNRHCGSALLADEPLIARILSTVVNAVSVPVTLKIRTGVDREHRNALRVAAIAQSCGIAALAIHGRTRADLFTGEAEHVTSREVRRAVCIPVIVNGDIDSAHRAEAAIAYTQADGVMIGRAAQGAPWIFRDVNAYLTTKKLPPPLLRASLSEIILQHLEFLYDFYGEHTGVRMARKHLGWYSRHHPQAEQLRRQLMSAEDSVAQFAAASQAFTHWSAAA
jgi:tRNA-dihydrouridine synthase B